MDSFKALQHALDTGAYVRLELEDGGHEGFVVGLSHEFVLLQAVYEWQDVGAMVIPIEAVAACDVSDYHDEQVQILEFNSVKRTKRYAWVKLDSFAALFRSLKLKDKFVVVSSEDEADVGQVASVNEDYVELKAVTPGGSWIDEPIECAFDNITVVAFDDSYSRVLQRFIGRAAKAPL